MATIYLRIIAALCYCLQRFLFNNSASTLGGGLMGTITRSDDSVIRLKLAVLPALVLILFLALPSLASAQCSTSGNAPCAGALLTTYYNTLVQIQNVPAQADNIVELINPVGTANPALTGTLVNACAMIYVFDANENMGKCCGCLVSPHGLLTLSVRSNLTANWNGPGATPVAGSIDVISASTNGGNPFSCNAATPYTLSPALNGYITHSLGNAEVQFADAGDPSSALQTSLINRCARLSGNSTTAACTCPSNDLQ